MKYAARVDANQLATINAFKAAMPDASVYDASACGEGFPDLVVGWRGRNYLFEVKNPDVRPSDRRLTDPQAAFHGSWQGQVHVAHSAAEMLAVMLRLEAGTPTKQASPAP
jgi:hypothetical protein